MPNRYATPVEPFRTSLKFRRCLRRQRAPDEAMDLVDELLLRPCINAQRKIRLRSIGLVVTSLLLTILLASFATNYFAPGSNADAPVVVASRPTIPPLWDLASR